MLLVALDRTDLEQLVGQLRTAREQLVAAIDARLHQHGLEHHNEAALPRRAQDTDDDATAETQRNADVSALTRATRELTQVEAALRRVADGSFGLCVDCEEPIERARLRAHPAASRCTECQGFAERAAQHAARTHN